MKQMKRFAALALTGAMALSLAACGSGDEKPTPGATPTPSATPAQTASYTASAKGYGGDVTVKLTVAGTTVDALTAEGPNETENIGGAGHRHLQRGLRRPQRQGGLLPDRRPGRRLRRHHDLHRREVRPQGRGQPGQRH